MPGKEHEQGDDCAHNDDAPVTPVQPVVGGAANDDYTDYSQDTTESDSIGFDDSSNSGGSLSLAASNEEVSTVDIGVGGAAGGGALGNDVPPSLIDDGKSAAASEEECPVAADGAHVAPTTPAVTPGEAPDYYIDHLGQVHL